MVAQPIFFLPAVPLSLPSTWSWPSDIRHAWKSVIFTLVLTLKIWNATAATAAKSLHSCPTLCDPIDGSPPGSAVPGILQERTLEWVAISFSKLVFPITALARSQYICSSFLRHLQPSKLSPPPLPLECQLCEARIVTVTARSSHT